MKKSSPCPGLDDDGYPPPEEPPKLPGEPPKPPPLPPLLPPLLPPPKPLCCCGGGPYWLEGAVEVHISFNNRFETIKCFQ